MRHEEKIKLGHIVKSIVTSLCEVPSGASLSSVYLPLMTRNLVGLQEFNIIMGHLEKSGLVSLDNDWVMATDAAYKITKKERVMQ